MKRLTILGIIACAGFLFAPTAVLGAPVGPPGGLDVKIVNPIPLPVTGEVDAKVTGEVNATVTGDVNVTNTPNVNVVNDEAYPVPVRVQNGGELVIIREGYMVPEGKILKIVDMTVQCSKISPEPGMNGTAYLTRNLTAQALLQISYDDFHCPEDLTGQPPECPRQLYSLGLSANYHGHSVTPDTPPLPVLGFYAGRQVNITAFAGAKLRGLCSGSLEEFMGYSIATGQGYLIDAASP